MTLDPAREMGSSQQNAASEKQASTGLGAWKRLEEREGTEVILNVWNSKRQELRGALSVYLEVPHLLTRHCYPSDVPIVPSRAWSSAGSSSTSGQPSLLGLSLRFCDPSTSLSNVWHILEILEGSPAESAGLVPYGDFIIGWTGGPLRGEGEFYELIEAHVDKALRLYVYNSDYDHTREVIIVPNREWGGEGLLGCGVGYGLLHRIPKPSDEARVQAEGLVGESQNFAGVDALTPRIGSGGFPSDVEATPTQNGIGPKAGRGSLQATPRAGHESIAEADEELEEQEGEHEGDHSQGVTVSVRQEEEEDDELL